MFIGINPTDQHANVPVRSELKHKCLRFQCALLPIAIKPMLALGLIAPGMVLAKYVVQRSLMSKQKETVDMVSLLRG